MKVAILGLLFSISSFAVEEIHIQKGEQLKVVVEGCASSEYGFVRNPGYGNTTITTGCQPKVCTYRSPIWFGTTIRLFHSGEVVAKTNSAAETREVLEKLVVDGVCAKTEKLPPK